MKLSSTGYEAQIRRARLALKGACCAGRRHGLPLALALLVALLNPALCVLHCVILHGAHGAPVAPGQGHASHQHHAAPGHGHAGHQHHAALGQQPAADPAAPVTLCDLMRQAERSGEPTPRALYELAPLAALLVALTLLPLHAPAAAPPPIRALPRRSPPTPPPRPLAPA